MCMQVQSYDPFGFYNSEAVKITEVGALSIQKRRYFEFEEIPIEKGRSLEEMDADKTKSAIQKWAKAVVAHARLISSNHGFDRS